ncbi:MarR family winged helix-turn-helix transcriptional regulator [Paraburkholderia sp. C35]|uniref:MarR family winged helix-turn-helix transcriptional regulator n=1 Tax=Paraburkholderia sp. C35 TaxID=2126993 RepID=UPI000D699D01|nr:MarR family winged helix-turn-helix transcriptional regulator [Paraburkholderia sp. C35]
METFLSDSDDCFAVRQAARHISKLYERHLSKAGITPTQFNILSALDQNPESTMVQLSDALVMDRTTLVRLIKPLLRSNLLTTSEERPSDRRMRLLLTCDGNKKLAEATTHWREAQTAFEQTFGRKQAASLRSELFRITREVIDA